eukprot:CAMPEP_0171239124 /NCGR_PEP_ID=MMETSP0790-20130122/43818_1 /TAXON_ID=2925 /ORGANISM="Alexandrium catenella, Strain OF101" /LENGTH=50 /DNA_ID=CAMNT_0011705493 /DNA_START=31 /DNA_END=180 /DNA_ORIENTATION=+
MPLPVHESREAVIGVLLVTSHMGCSPPMALLGWEGWPLETDASTQPVKKW